MPAKLKHENMVSTDFNRWSQEGLLIINFANKHGLYI